MRGIKRAEISTNVSAALDMIRLQDYAGRLPSELSGGQRQRVALARAIVIEPSMLLLDEPLGALDKGLRESMQIEIRSLQKRLGLTTVMVTHDQDEALTMADRVVVMRDGRIEQAGTAEEIYRKPVSNFVANFIGASNLFSGKVVAVSAEGGEIQTEYGLRLQVDWPVELGQQVTVSVRPEAISLVKTADEGANQRNAVAAVVEQIVYRGFMTQYHLRCQRGEHLVVFRQNMGDGRDSELAVRDEIFASWAASSNHGLTQGSAS